MVERAYWGTLKEPLKPSASDVELFSRSIVGSATLLGCTKELMPLCVVAFDADPYYVDPKIQVSDWTACDFSTESIIADGSFNIIPIEDCNLIIAKAQQSKARLVVRFFNSRLDSMRVAFNFCANESFKTQPDECLDFEDYRFLVWKFDESRP